MPDWKERLDLTKSGLDVLKSLLILGIAFLLLFYSKFFNDLLDRYKVSQSEFGGAKFDRVQTVNSLKEASAEVPALTGKLAAAQKELAEVKQQYSKAVDVLLKVSDAQASNQPLSSSASQSLKQVLAQKSETISAAKAAGDLLDGFRQSPTAIHQFADSGFGGHFWVCSNFWQSSQCRRCQERVVEG